MLDLLFETRSNPEDPSVPLSELDPADWGGGSGVSVESAMGLSAVYSCIGVLGRSMGQLPLHVMRRDANGVVSRATDHPVYYLLHDEPNPFQTSYDWRESGMVHVSGWGNHYTEIVRHPRSGEVRELGLIRPWESNLTKTNSGRHTYAVTADDTRARAVSPEDMIHIKAIGSDGKVGKSPITQCREAFALGIETQGYGNQFFRSGGKPTGIVSVKSQLEEKSWKRLLDRWRKSKAEMQSNDNKTLFLPSELAYQSITIPPEDAQFLETRKFSRSEVAGIYNVPAHMINDLEKATFSNISEQAIQFVRHTMIPWVVKWEQELNRKLFTEQERRAGYYVKFNLNGLLRGTAKERAEFYSKAIRDGWMNRNQVRELEDMNQADGLDTYLLSADLQPKEVNPNE
ncbi:phage portal protein [Vibrio alginolyticus]|uniref:phage portal protein n=1 Tax=Vibrio TaxID=662 RepID=UPI001EEB99A2|nr:MULTISPECIES: phage portal protein [Vibrio]ELI5395217.1 phage portal protein [Vibrio parahaemolyticus]MCG6308984.1 phage portal protein [Vibrio alginolyticus]MDW3133769.1 phage portal protein [Vibrio sp. 1288]